MKPKANKMICPKCCQEMERDGFRHETKYKCKNEKCRTVVEQFTLF